LFIDFDYSPHIGLLSLSLMEKVIEAFLEK
jgi:hypothetical protein